MTADVLLFTLRQAAAVVRDHDLSHQIDFVMSEDQCVGLGVRVTCNCGAVAPQNHVDLDEAWRMYRAHLGGAW